MENFTLDARQVKAAMIMQAKNDVRYYLNGLLIGGGKIVATDGHRMIIVDAPKADFEPAIIAVKGRFVKAATECNFIFMGDDYGVVTCKNKFGVELDQVLKFSIIEGRFPDYKRVIPDGKPKKISEVGFNIGYMSDVSKAAIALGSQFNSGCFTFYEMGDGTAAVVDIHTPENKAKCVIMAVRL